MNVYVMSAFSVNRSGPGKRPWMSRPPRSTAAVGLPGRDHGGGDGGVVRAFRSADAFRIAGSEPIGVLVELFGLVIGHEPGDLPARSGDDADDGADEAADAQRAQVAPMCLDHLPQHTLLWLEGQFFEEDMRIRHQIDDLGDGKQADERGHEGDAAVERFMDDETGFPGQGAVSYSRQQHAERAAEQPFEHGPGGEPRDDGNAEDGCPEQFRGPEAHGEFSHRGGEQDHDQHAEYAADKGAYKNGVEGFLGPSLLGHRIPVEQRGDA